MASEFRNVIAWQKSVALAVRTCRVCDSFPRHEVFGLAAQMRRAAVSVPSNIAEGRGRNTAREYRQFLYQARGSAYELETQIEIARQLGYLEAAEAMTADVNEVQRLINGIIRSLDARV